MFLAKVLCQFQIQDDQNIKDVFFRKLPLISLISSHFPTGARILFLDVLKGALDQDYNLQFHLDI